MESFDKYLRVCLTRVLMWNWPVTGSTLWLVRAASQSRMRWPKPAAQRYWRGWLDRLNQ